LCGRRAHEYPGKLAQIAYGLLPRDIFLHVQQTEKPHAEELAMLRGILDVIDQVCPDGSPVDVLAGIEQDLRARSRRKSRSVAITPPAYVKSESDQKVDGDG
jgi:hypothetical protein